LCGSVCTGVGGMTGGLCIDGEAANGMGWMVLLGEGTVDDVALVLAGDIYCCCVWVDCEVCESKSIVRANRAAVAEGYVSSSLSELVTIPPAKVAPLTTPRLVLVTTGTMPYSSNPFPCERDDDRPVPVTGDGAARRTGATREDDSDPFDACLRIPSPGGAEA
jgi:hypothetical protein